MVSCCSAYEKRACSPVTTMASLTILSWSEVREQRIGKPALKPLRYVYRPLCHFHGPLPGTGVFFLFCWLCTCTKPAVLPISLVSVSLFRCWGSECSTTGLEGTSQWKAFVMRLIIKHILFKAAEQCKL